MTAHYKILCTGNPLHIGIAKELNGIFPNIDFISRSNGYDFSDSASVDKFKEIIGNYNIFINHSQLVDNMQEELLIETAKLWDEGHVINIGSVLEINNIQWLDPKTAEEKCSLRARSLILRNEKFKTTHMIIGGFNDQYESEGRSNPKNIALMIKWILESNIDIPLIWVDKINDARNKKWLEDT